MTGVRLLVISPVRNEAEHVEHVIEAMRAQRCPPDLWLVVDDGSTDGTLELLRAAEPSLPFMRVLAAPQRGIPGGPDRLAVAAEARAFNWALAQPQAAGPFDFVSKLDGDIVLDPGHYERLLAEMATDPRLGIAGCYLEQPARRGGWELCEMPGYHVNGALKLYRRECLQEIGGMRERLGWDTIDETYARMGGWRTCSFRDLRARHLRPSGSVGGVLRGRARHGECVWIVAYPPSLVLLRSLRLLAASPPLLSGLAFLGGYARAALRRRGGVEDPAFRAFSRGEQRSRMRARARAALGLRRAGSTLDGAA